MSQDQLLTVPTQERLQEIRDADTASGENLQFCPAAWTQRRELLLYIDARGRRVMTGEGLYATYESSHAARNCSVDTWMELDQENRDTWEQMAENITQGFQS